MSKEKSGVGKGCLLPLILSWFFVWTWLFGLPICGKTIEIDLFWPAIYIKQEKKMLEVISTEELLKLSISVAKQTRDMEMGKERYDKCHSLLHGKLNEFFYAKINEMGIKIPETEEEINAPEEEGKK